MPVKRARKKPVKKAAGRRTTAARSTPEAKRKSKPGPKAEPRIGPKGIRTAPKGDRFYAPEMAIRKYALGMPEASEDFPWGHRAFRVNKKVFLFLAWDDGAFSLTAKLPQSQSVALMLPFAELTGYGMGKSGWVTARFAGKDEVPVPLLCRWTDESFRAIAPKKLAALVPA
jgi:predicted DNA-binding protein (MmcQ/YjbR family)